MLPGPTYLAESDARHIPRAPRPATLPTDAELAVCEARLERTCRRAACTARPPRTKVRKRAA